MTEITAAKISQGIQEIVRAIHSLTQEVEILRECIVEIDKSKNEVNNG